MLGNQLDVLHGFSQARVQTEAFFQSLIDVEQPNEEFLNELRTKITSLHKAYHGKKSFIPSKFLKMKNVLNDLSKDKSIFVSKPDKGNGVVIVDREYYVRQMNAILADGTKFRRYKCKSKKDPFIFKEEQFNRKLKKMKAEQKISEEIYSFIKTSGSQPPRLYGLPKIHKDERNPPFRPILSMVKSFGSRLAKWLHKLLVPFVPKHLIVQDSFQAKEAITAQQFNANEDSLFLCSLDAKSLFTNMPVEKKHRSYHHHRT